MAENENKNQARPIPVDDSETVSSYANFCRVTGSPEELIVDFGMNAQPMGTNDRPVEISQRIVLNFYTAKRLLHCLLYTSPSPRDQRGSRMPSSA